MPSINSETVTTITATATLAEIVDAFRAMYPAAGIPAGTPQGVDWDSNTGQAVFTWETPQAAK